MIRWAHRTMIVPAERVEFASSLCAAIAGPAGDGMFITPLSVTGSLPATHYISAGMIDESFASILPLDMPPTESTEAQRIHGNPEAVLASLPDDYTLMPTLAEFEALFAAVDITAGEPLTRLAQLGLSLCAEPEIVEGSD